LERAIIHIPDVRSDPTYGLRVIQDAGWRTGLGVPLLREGAAIGAVGMWRRDVRPFSDGQIELLKTFAHQAVIAIENVRLFNELQARTGELTRSVSELTALGEVSRALSSTLDLETVLQTIVLRANELAGTAGCNIWEYDEPREQFQLRASHYADERDAAILRASGRVTTIRRGQGVTTRVMERREPVQIADIAIARAYESPIRQPLIDAGHRALLGVPLVSEDEVIGVLAVTRKTPGEFEPETVRLLTTFATQSSLAIQNARLFREIEDKSRQIEVASHHKSEFLANMSHELRTPLNAILGFSEVLAEGMFGEVNDKQAEYLRDILESGRHLLSLINDILDLSKIEAGRMELEPTDFDLPSAIDNALTLVRERAGRRGITPGREIDARVGIIRGDERKVMQIVLNLLSNAIKFTPEGGRIDVRAAVNKGLVEISVTDTGVGIAPEDQETVFEEFRQVGTADKKMEGTGLGLALSRKFVELHGGRIWVKSQVGKGSTFTFTLPARPGDKDVSLQ
jgi:signal transduction histidine kinase